MQHTVLLLVSYILLVQSFGIYSSRARLLTSVPPVPSPTPCSASRAFYHPEEAPCPPHDHQHILVKYKGQTPPLSFQSEPGKELGLKIGVLRLHIKETVTEGILRVQSLPEVEYAEPDFRIELAEKVSKQPEALNDPLWPEQWALHSLDLPTAISLATKAAAFPASDAVLNAATVCIIDTGLDLTHPDLKLSLHPKFPRGLNARYPASSCRDSHGHGTHLAGTVAATANNGIGVAGINGISGRIVSCRFITGFAPGLVEHAIKCLNWCVTRANTTISVNSYAGPGYSESFREAIGKAGERDHLFLAAAGNGGRNLNLAATSEEFYPAGYQIRDLHFCAICGGHRLINEDCEQREVEIRS